MSGINRVSAFLYGQTDKITIGKESTVTDMKLIHLSDLHLGKRVNEYSMIEDQQYILTKIINIIDEEKPEAVILAGDIYDKPVPPAEAVELFDDFLYSLAGRKLQPDVPTAKRVLIGFDVTDELFGIGIARKGWLNPWYFYGAMTSSIPGWAIGTMLGVIMGNLLPARIVSALSVALYGMFLAIIIPPARESRIVGVLVAVCFLLSWLCSVLPAVSALSSGTRTIILTIGISTIAALLFPHTDEEAS